jgi:hypothetical protein
VSVRNSGTVAAPQGHPDPVPRLGVPFR